MAFEKGSDVVTESQHVHEDASSNEMMKPTAVTTAHEEAVGVYGNAATAEELGYVHRGYV